MKNHFRVWTCYVICWNNRMCVFVLDMASLCCPVNFYCPSVDSSVNVYTTSDHLFILPHNRQVWIDWLANDR